MSNMEYHKGTITKAFKDKHNFNEGLHRLIETSRVPETIEYDEEDNYIDSQIFHFIDGEFYEIKNHIEFDPDNIFETSSNSNGSIDFTVGFYNGGGCLSEIIEGILTKHKESK